MSAHFSKFGLNTYNATPYFRAHVPAGYPLGDVLVKGRAFRRLPPRLRELSGLAKAVGSPVLFARRRGLRRPLVRPGRLRAGPRHRPAA
jgi:hypothetical protein